MRSREGVCALTGVTGKFIKCHIIPEALTETLWQGQPLSQRGQNGKIIRRWTSWYDPALVVLEGESILQRYDDWAIRFFRERKLIWRSWGPMRKLSSSYYEFYDDHFQIGMRKLIEVDTTKLRSFYLSVLWRAAACNLWEFSNVRLPQEDLARLRCMIVNGNPSPWSFYPLSLIQLCTQTVPFNQALSRLTKYEAKSDEEGNLDFEKPVAIEYFRVYFDGLIGTLNIDKDPIHFESAKQIFVSDNSDISILLLPSEKSASISNLSFHRGLPVPSEHLPYLLNLHK